MKYLQYYVYAVIVLLIDQATKWVIVNRLVIGESRSVIGEFFQITSHRNKGAAFGILQNQRWFFIVITIFVVIGIIWYLKKTLDEGKKLLPFALSLLLGGALGNFIDRARTGEVVDFFQFTFDFSWLQTPYIFPIFNVADSAIVSGVALIFLDALISWRREAKQNVKTGSESGDLQP
ncbi:signal peptidase II [Paenibacillus validus]|uniref:Lipoprotein signal peptidase n=1 Tax=Paenibacillus validus TaxID=44253 RepID=A0A7X2ZD25_9BACL|nr:signal peptidase II [Paenibacillus validus]MED4603624.1 signal peptidase II [Paenibacillus validus]MED4605813.1 signal peptidase II [Paenibacillus validus]MUG72618.1 lipoprotein signal peptidase [Paenibacillus validus]